MVRVTLEKKEGARIEKRLLPAVQAEVFKERKRKLRFYCPKPSL